MIGESCEQVLTSVYSSFFWDSFGCLWCRTFSGSYFHRLGVKNPGVNATVASATPIDYSYTSCRGWYCFVCRSIHSYSGVLPVLWPELPHPFGLIHSCASSNRRSWASHSRSSNSMSISRSFIVALASLALVPIAFSWPTKGGSLQLENKSIGLVAGKEITMNDLII